VDNEFPRTRHVNIPTLNDDELTQISQLSPELATLTDITAIQDYLRQIARHNPPAVIWRRLLAAGANQPATIGHALRSLTWDHNILIAHETTRLMGQLLQAIYPTLTAPERECVENAILHIPAADGVDVDVAMHYRDRLLGCLDASQVTSAARAQYDATAEQGGPPSNREDDTLAGWGPISQAPITTDPELAAFLTPVAAFAEQHLNTVPRNDAVAAILPNIKKLYDEITKPDATMASAVVNEAFTHIARCGFGIGRSDEITEEQAALFLPLLLHITTQDSPALEPEQDRRESTEFQRARKSC
jgi:hypothetical protein